MVDRRLVLVALEELRGNADQYAAATETGHCVVLAGPGSGKTKTLTTAMARALLVDVRPPRGVACITYSNECAIELETRLERLAVEATDEVFIGTVHGFALAQVISPYAALTLPELPADFRIATDHERDDAIEGAFRDTINDNDEPARRWKFASEKRKTQVDRTQPDWRGRNAELADFVEAYESRLRARGLIDFEDMPLLAYRIVRDNAWVRNALRAKFPILFVDEYQDLGTALHELVLLLCFAGGVRLFAVGDTDQSIYGFTGANPDLLESLAGRKDVKVHQLAFNYRSGRKIVDASMAALGQERGYKTAGAAREGEVFFLGIAGDIDAQAAGVARNIVAKLMAAGTPPEEIGVLYRAAKDGNALATAFRAEQIAIVRSDNNALVRRNSRLSRFIEACAKWVVGGWRDANPQFRRLAAEAVRLVYGVGASEQERDQIAVELASFLHASIGGQTDAHTWLKAFEQEVIAVWRRRARTVDGDWDDVAKLIKRTRTGESDAELTLAHFGGLIVGSGRVNLSTLHSAKGREFDAVVLFGASEGAIPNSYEQRDPKQSREARRLFYVGVTRPRHTLFVAYQKGRPSPWVVELSNRINKT